MTSRVIYKGNLRTEAVHLASGHTIETDAPTDNQGKGERFSPTDLVATALASCIVTTMGIAALSRNYNLDGTTCDVQKIMTAAPRRIGEIVVDIHFPATAPTDEKDREVLKRIAHTCPVELSLHPDVVRTINFHWL